MNTNVPSYAERVTVARQRLDVALDPRTEAERTVMQWIADWDLPTLEPLAAMIERARIDAMDGISIGEIYHLGYADGGVNGRRERMAAI